MGSLKGHWTNRDTEDFLYKIGFDFVNQIQDWVDADLDGSRAEFAKRLGVSKGRVSQVLNDPGNLTLRLVVEYARSLGRKVSIVAYDDRDPSNQNGPVSSQVFASCWEKSGRPPDLFACQLTATTANNFGLGKRYSDGRTAHGNNQLYKFGQIEFEKFKSTSDRDQVGHHG